MRVLVVDDAQHVLDVVTDMLECSGVNATVPTSWLSDLSMPGKGGYWLIGRVCALSPGLGSAAPAAALTAYTAAEHRASVIRAGFQCHVAKPVGVRELVGVVAILALKEEPSGRLVD